MEETERKRGKEMKESPEMLLRKKVNFRPPSEIPKMYMKTKEIIGFRQIPCSKNRR